MFTRRLVVHMKIAFWLRIPDCADFSYIRSLCFCEVYASWSLVVGRRTSISESWDSREWWVGLILFLLFVCYFSFPLCFFPFWVLFILLFGFSISFHFFRVSPWYTGMTPAVWEGRAQLTRYESGCHKVVFFLEAMRERGGGRGEGATRGYLRHVLVHCFQFGNLGRILHSRCRAQHACVVCWWRGACCTQAGDIHIYRGTYASTKVLHEPDRAEAIIARAW
jgi:hypothetical protein